MVKNHVENKNWREITNKLALHPLNETLQIRIMSSDPETGAMTSIIDLPKTTSSDQILAADCELQIFVLEGELQFDNISMKPVIIATTLKNLPTESGMPLKTPVLF